MTSALVGSSLVWATLAVCLGAVITGRRKLVRLAAVIISASSVVLVFALVSADFSLDYVVRTTSLATPWPYRVAALWGGMSGSLLFYSTLTLGVSASAARTTAGVRTAGVVGLGLVLLTIFFANPFQVLDIPAVDGEGLLAILQHPAMVYHPPILYLGLTTLVVPFSLTVAHAFGQMDRDRWRVDVRRWMYVSWTLLTLGMAAGANWAYVELGWGGYWAWDPVENTALMPWLAATVFLHSSRLEQSSGSLRRWTLFMAGAPFALTIVGIYLTRSGSTGSIHSFAEDPGVGLVLIGTTLVALGFLVVISMRSEPGEFFPTLSLNRNGWLAVNGVLVSSVLVFVAAGSIYPAVQSVVFDDSVIVDTRFYVTAILPLAVLIAVSLALSIERRRPVWLVAVGIGLAVGGLGYGLNPGLVLFGVAFGSAATLLFGLVSERRSGHRLVIRLAHLGMAVVLVGVAGSSFGDEFEGPMRIGDRVEVGGHTVVLSDIVTGDAERYIFVTAKVDVDGDLLTPQIRAYESQNVPVAEPAITSDPLDDVIVAVSLLFPDGETVDVSVFVRPLVWWVWVGSLLIVLAGLVFLAGKGGASAKQHRLARAVLPQEGTTTGTDVR